MPLPLKTALFEPRYTYREAAPIIGVSEITLRRWVMQGRIPHLKIGYNVRFTESMLQEYLDSCIVPAQEDRR